MIRKNEQILTQRIITKGAVSENFTFDLGQLFK